MKKLLEFCRKQIKAVLRLEYPDAEKITVDDFSVDADGDAVVQATITNPPKPVRYLVTEMSIDLTCAPRHKGAKEE